MRSPKKAGLLILALGAMLCTAQVARANTYVFVTAPGATVNPGTGPVAVNTSVTFITALNQITIRITNLQMETAGSDIQTIDALDFHMQGITGASISPTLFSWLGEAGNLHDNGGGQSTYSNDGLIYNSTGGNLANHWGLFTSFVGPGAASAGAQISGGIQLTTITGGQPTETILGPANTAPNTYLANNSLLNHNPLLRTNANTYIEYVIHFSSTSGVTASTVVDTARMSFGTAFSSTTEVDLQKFPEPGTWALMIGGIGLMAGWRRLRRPKGRSDGTNCE